MNIRSHIQFRQRSSPHRAFTLIELLVVIVIIGLLARIALPAIRGLTKSNAMIAANRQVLDDLTFARRTAIANRTTVYVVFIPGTIATDSQFDINNFTNSAQMRTLVSNLYRGQFTSYALLSLRTVGDQPGSSTPHYFTSWRTLPNGVLFSTNKFTNYNQNILSEYQRAFPVDAVTQFPFPSAQSLKTVTNLPYIGFDYLGRLISPNFEAEAIPLVRGSILYTQNDDGTFNRQTPNIVITPPEGSPLAESNVIHIDWFTGKARAQRQDIQ